jgi:hypothetical protein
MPSELSELIIDSDIIAIVNVVAINAQGKSKPGIASVKIKTLIKGSINKESLDIYWQGIAITELGEWIVFIKHNQDQNHYQATYGPRSFWKIDYAESKNGDCCSPFVVLRYPVTNLIIPSNLVSEQAVFFNGVPKASNPIPASGLLIESLITHIKNTPSKE